MAQEVWWLRQTQLSLGSCHLERGERCGALRGSGLACLPAWEHLVTERECQGNIQTKPSCHKQLSRHSVARVATASTPTVSPVSTSSPELSHKFFLPHHSLHWTLHGDFRENNRPRAPVKIRGEGGRGMVDNDCLHDQLRNDLIWHSRRLSTQVPGIHYLIIYEWELWELRPVTVTRLCRTFIVLTGRCIWISQYCNCILTWDRYMS